MGIRKPDVSGFRMVKSRSIDHGRADIQAVHDATNRSRHDNKNRVFFVFWERVEIAWGSRVSLDQSERPFYSCLW